MQKTPEILSVIIRNIFLFLLLGYNVAFASGHPETENKPIGLPVFSDNFRHYVTTLASDEFEGREPITPGGKKTKDFIESEFRRIGLTPAYNGSFRQPVPVFRNNISNISDFSVTNSTAEVSFSVPEEVIITMGSGEGTINFSGSEVVFAGYGIVAPEYEWDDYNDKDLTGKTVLILLNDPGYATGDSALFGGATWTSFSSIRHKSEQAAERGAAAVFFIHEEASVRAPWNRLVSRAGRSRIQLERGNTTNTPIVQGWMNEETAATILEKAGYNFESKKAMSIKREFESKSLSVNASVSFDIEKEAGCYNIAGYIRGSEFPNETVIYLAHWDHLGKRETPEGTVIYNGAIDNATGTAAIMAIAERFALMDPPPARSVLFLAVTAEESGLLGSRYYVNNPIFPLATTAGVINIDMMNITGPTRDLFMIGYGMTDMQEILRKHLASHNRVLLPDPQPEQNFFRRSDHYSFARAGVPVVFTYGGTDFFGTNAQELKELYDIDDKRYHTPDDIVHEHWDWAAIDNNLWMFFNLGEDLANSRQWPVWNDDSPYREERIKTDGYRNP